MHTYVPHVGRVGLLVNITLADSRIFQLGVFTLDFTFGKLQALYLCTFVKIQGYACAGFSTYLLGGRHEEGSTISIKTSEIVRMVQVWAC